MNLNAICQGLLDSRGFHHKNDISPVMKTLASAASANVRNGDDCAAIPQDNGYLLFAMEGFVPDFLDRMPWFAGYCGVMVNVSDIYAMGGRPTAVLNTIWANGNEQAGETLAGLVEASKRYKVPIVGGHTNLKSAQRQLAVAILGKATKLLSSFDARPGDDLLVAIDLRGKWEEPYPYWNASTTAPTERLLADLEILPALAEEGLCAAAKDISMAGVLGTALMLLECSNAGADIDLEAIPRPTTVSMDNHEDLLRWLLAFPSYGFVLSVHPKHTNKVLERFECRGIPCSVAGKVTAGTRVAVRAQNQYEVLWDLSERRFITAVVGDGVPS